MPIAYRIRVVCGDSQFEVEGDKRFVLDMLAKHWPHAGAPVGPLEPPLRQPKGPLAPIALPTAGKKTSVSEFIRQLGFKKHTDMVLGFGYYLEKMSGLNSFTPADINTCYYEAKLESSNTSQMIIRNIHTSRMMPAKQGTDKGRRAYILTRTGEEFVEKSIEKKPPKPAK